MRPTPPLPPAPMRLSQPQRRRGPIQELQYAQLLAWIPPYVFVELRRKATGPINSNAQPQTGWAFALCAATSARVARPPYNLSQTRTLLTASPLAVVPLM